MNASSDQPHDSLPATVQKRITRTKLTPERLAKYVEVLSLTGSHFEAARVASPFANEVQPGSEKHGGTTPPSCYDSFRKERKVNPEFAEACEAAIQVAIGAAESELARRMMLPTERATIDKAGNIVHVTKDYRNADLLLMRFLARHKPDDWTERNRIDSNVTVSGNTSGGSVGVTIPVNDLQFLTDDERGLLSDLLRAMMERKEIAEQQKTPAALPSPSGEKA